MARWFIVRDGEECGHPGCGSHVSHPCENCGRIGARGEVNLDVYHYLILVKLFKGRCPNTKCGHAIATTVHELVPRARGKRSGRLTNRTMICRECHDSFHKNGASTSQIEKWRNIIREYLEGIGTSEKYYAEQSGDSNTIGVEDTT